MRTNAATAITVLLICSVSFGQSPSPIGRELSSYERIANGDEFEMPVRELLRRGKLAFDAQWTIQQGGLRPMTGGTGNPIVDPSSALVFPRNFNRVSAMDANSCAGCHNAPFGLSGGGGDFVTGVFVAAQRFDFATFDSVDPLPRRGALNEAGRAVQLGTIGNYRATVGMSGSGYIEMLARQMTADLQVIRDQLPPGGSAELRTKGVRFGVLTRQLNGQFEVSGVEGLPPQALAGEIPSLVIRPFHQSGSVVSLREFTNNAYNHHHGIQTEERFGSGVDADGDGIVNELTIADVTSVAVFQATLSAPGQVVPNDLRLEEAIYYGERLFDQIGCTTCHITQLPLDDEGGIYTEPNPYNPPQNLRAEAYRTYAVDLTSDELPGHRLKPVDGIVWVPAFTDLKLHDITQGADDPGREALNINHPGGTPGFLDGNSQFLTKKLWGAANERPYMHHGKFNTLREATLAHFGEAEWTRDNFLALSGSQQDQVVEFLKSLQVLPPDVRSWACDENGKPKLGWPPKDFFSWAVTSTTRRSITSSER